MTVLADRVAVVTGTSSANWDDAAADPAASIRIPRVRIRPAHEGLDLVAG